MASTREIRRRIKSVKNTAQITKAMQMVAASKMRKAQELALAGRPYSEILTATLRDIGRTVSLGAHPLCEVRSLKRTTVLVITSDKGLCGALNNNILRKVADLPRETTDFVSLGRKGRQTLANLRRTLVADFEFGDTFEFRTARQLGKFLAERFLSGQTDQVLVAYNDFINTISQRPEIVPLLPLGAEVTGKLKSHLTDSAPEPAEKSDAPVAEFLFEPSAAEVLNTLMPHALNYQIWRYMLEAKASEHSARMIAMKNATDNAKQLVKDLTLEYNKARQAGITNEILEISAAAAALN
jgi:F-type H+-transporting ATPase subunit gamma